MVKLRRACADDGTRLFRWRIDVETVRQSIEPPPDSLDAHGQWLDRVLRNADVALFIAHDDARGVDVGTVRLDRRAAGDVEMSITVDPGERGSGYSHDLIARGIEAAGNVRILARIKSGNLRSLRAFRALGFDGSEDATGEFIELVHSPVNVNRRAEA